MTQLSLSRYVSPSLSKLLLPITITVTTSLFCPLPARSATIVSDWVTEALDAVKNNPIGPTAASRAYGILGTAMYDAWSAYETTPISTIMGDSLQRPSSENTLANKQEAVSYAAYRVLTELFPSQASSFNDLMLANGFDPNNLTSDATTAAGIGNTIADNLMLSRRNDGSNQLGGYADTTGYKPVNTPENVIDIARWTPEHLPIDNASNPLQKFLTPQWGEVTPFALTDGSEFRPEAPESFLLVEGATVNLDDRAITLADNTVVPIDKSIVGTIINPEFIEQAEEVVEFSANLTDEQKLIAEFWEDPGSTYFPPGHWLEFGQIVSQRDGNTLDEDAMMFFSLGNAVMDAGIATWEAKTYYDYTRPVRAIRELGRLGLIGTDDGTGTFWIEAWGGVGKGTQLIPATEFTTYQTPGSHPSPPFAEYTSGHSAFSAAAAEILKLFTGSDSFGASVTFNPGDSRFEPGLTPTDSITLSWDTFTEAADEAGISRRYGGIHFADGDLQGRILGRNVGAKVWDKSQFYINGGVNIPEPSTTFAVLSLASLFFCRKSVRIRG
jgi:hypothetical protein